MPIVHLGRTVLKLSGENLLPWLEGLVTNSLKSDLTFTALLTPQGKIIADFFVTKTQTGVLMDTPHKFAPDLLKRLKMYKLREKIEIEDVSETHFVHAFWDEENEEGFADPRVPALGRRLILDHQSPTALNEEAYDAHRLSLGVPDSQWDFETVTTFPADAYMDILAGVDFKKGCFVGQEVVSRMKRMTTVKKRMRGILLDGPAGRGDKIMSGERVIGEVLHARGNSGIATVRLERLRAADVGLTVNENPLAVMRAPDGLDR